MVLNDTSPKGIAQFNKKVENEKSFGSDGISDEKLKFCSPGVKEQLSEGFNECL